MFTGAPMETRTPVLALKGPRANRYTMGATNVLAFSKSWGATISVSVDFHLRKRGE